MAFVHQNHDTGLPKQKKKKNGENVAPGVIKSEA